MCDDNWRSIGKLAGDVIERVRKERPGPRVVDAIDRPAGAREGGTPLRLEWKKPDGSSRPAVVGRDKVQVFKEPSPAFGRPVLSRLVASRDRRTVFPPPNEAPASAVRRSLIVVVHLVHQPFAEGLPQLGPAVVLSLGVVGPAMHPAIANESESQR